MDRNKLIGIAAIGGGLIWYMNSQSSASTLPAATTPAATTTTTTTDNTDDTSTTETTDGDDSSNVGPCNCDKYREEHHAEKKVWFNSQKKKEFSNAAYKPKGIKMEDFETNQEQYFVNQEVEWELDLSVYNTSKANCGEYGASKGYVDKKCWLPPYADGGAGGGDGGLSWTVVWTDPQGQTYADDSGVMTVAGGQSRGPGKTSWSNLNGKFRIPNNESSCGVWTVKVTYTYKRNADTSHSVEYDGDVFRVVPEDCGAEASAAETYKAEFTRPIFMPRISRQSFMQF